MIPVIRPALPDDAAELARLEREARAALVGTRGGDRWLGAHPEWGSEWPTVIERDIVRVGTVDDVVVAFLVGRVEGPLGRVLFPYVTPDARELGFGDELLAAALDAFRSAGAEVVDAEALPGDRQTKNLYERAGIKARLIILSAEL